MKVKVKKLHPNAVIPKYAKLGDAGLDLTAIDMTVHPDHKFYEYDTGLAFEIPEGYVGYVFPRSSVSKTNLSLCNSVGVIDSSYRGSVKLRFNKMEDSSDVEYLIGDRVGQLVIMPIPIIELEESDRLSITDRGDKGFGSTNVGA